MVISCLIQFRSSFSLGDHTLQVPFSLHKKNRDRLCERLKNNEDYQKGSVVLLEGGESKTRYSSDTDIVFRQVFKILIIRCGVSSENSSFQQILYFFLFCLAIYAS